MKRLKFIVNYFIFIVLTLLMSINILSLPSCMVSTEEVDVVLFVGQSNMVGRELQKYEVEIPDGYAFEYKYLTNELTNIKNPVGETFGEGDGKLEQSSGSSIVPQFCADYVKKTGRKIVVVHAACGGRSISYFQKDNDMYLNILAKYKACIEFISSIKSYTIGKCFYIMFQGESDTGSTSKLDYKSRFMDFHSGIKAEFKMEFGALLQTGLDVKTMVNGVPELTSEEDVARISEAKNELAEENDDIILINVKAMNYHINNPDYMLNDIYKLVHYNCQGLIEIASDSCDALINYLGYGDENLKGIDPVTYL